VPYRALHDERNAPRTKALPFDAHILQPSEENTTHVSAVTIDDVTGK
jgi:hypothetical protein